MRFHRLKTIAVAAGALGLAAPAAQAAAPGWSTPHTASAVTTGAYAAAPNGQGVQLFANGGVPQRTGQLRAIKTDATQGTAVGVNSGGPGFDRFGLSINNSARLVAAWSMDLENATPVSVAAAIGSRTSLPRTAAVFGTGGIVDEVATAIDDDGTAVVAWIQTPLGATTASATTIGTATLRSGQAPIVTTVATRAGAFVNDLGVGFDNDSHAVVTWAVAPDENTGPGIIGVARGTGPGAFSPAVESTVDPTQPLVDLRTFVTGDGSLLLFWTNGVSGGADERALQPVRGGRRLRDAAHADRRPGRLGPARVRGERGGSGGGPVPGRLGQRDVAPGDPAQLVGDVGLGAAGRAVGRAQDRAAERRRGRPGPGRGLVGRLVVVDGAPDPRRPVELVDQPAQHLQPGQPALGRPALHQPHARAVVER